MIQRRQLFPFIFAALTPPSIALSTMQAFARDLQNDGRPVQDSGFLEGCIFACEDPLSPQVGGSAPIDFWTSRVSDIESNHLPTCCRRIVVWDDLFSVRRVSRTLTEIFEAIWRFYEFDARHHPHQAGIHLDQISHLDDVLLSVLSARSRSSQSARMAIIDLDSTGVTSLNWPRIVPHLRAYYDCVVGIGGNTSAVGDVELSDHLERRWRASSAHCDLVVLLPERADSARSQPEYDEIVTYRTECVRKLLMLSREQLYAIGRASHRTGHNLPFVALKNVFA